MTFRKAFYSVIKIVAITFGLVILLGRRNQKGWGGGGWGIPPPQILVELEAKLVPSKDLV